MILELELDNEEVQKLLKVVLEADEDYLYFVIKEQYDSKKNAKYRVGQLVEIDRSTYLGAHIIKVNSDGTYRVKYQDDGYYKEWHTDEMSEEELDKFN